MFLRYTSIRILITKQYDNYLFIFLRSKQHAAITSKGTVLYVIQKT